MLGLDGSYEGQDMTAVPYHPDLKYLGFFFTMKCLQSNKHGISINLSTCES